MRVVRIALLSLMTASSVAVLAGQTPLGKDAADLRAHFGLQALSRYLETWNSRDPERWATSLNFPHVRPGPGAFELFKTPAQYAASVNFATTLATGWHHSEWTTRRVLQVGVDKVHVAGSWLRYTEDGRQLAGTSVTYIVTTRRKMLRTSAGAAVASFATRQLSALLAGDYWPRGSEWETLTPSDAAMDPAGDEGAFAYAADHNSTGLVVLRRGRIVAERYGKGWTPETAQPIFSSSKSITSTLVGMAMEEGCGTSYRGFHDHVAQPIRAACWQG